MRKFNIDDKVEVINSGCICPYCTEIFNHTGLNEVRHDHGNVLFLGAVCDVVYYSIAYGDNRYIILHNNLYYVITQEGLKLKEDIMNSTKAYLKMFKECGLGLGDKVRIARGFKDGEYGCELTEFSSINDYIGDVVVITTVENGSFKVDDNWSWPFYCLELVEKKENIPQSDINQFIDTLNFDCDEQREVVKKIANKIIEICLRHD
jgi:hypothetical protein